MMKNMEQIDLKLFGFYILLIIVILFSSITSNAQTHLTDDNFNQVNKGKSIIEFWAKWNESNVCDWIVDLEGAKIYRMDMNLDKAKEFKIKVLPTIIVLNNGIEVNRYEGNIQFKLCPKRTPKKVQRAIKEIDNLNRY